MPDSDGRHKDWKSHRLAAAGLRGKLWQRYLRTRYPDIKVGLTKNFHIEFEEWSRLAKHIEDDEGIVAKTKPNSKAQMTGPRTVPPDDLEERAWQYYYKYYEKMHPIDPMLLLMIKSIIEKEGSEPN